MAVKRAFQDAESRFMSSSNGTSPGYTVRYKSVEDYKKDDSRLQRFFQTGMRSSSSLIKDIRL
jgi:hypothetical protein